jgi:DNA-binding transcriptional MerR regulator
VKVGKMKERQYFESREVTRLVGIPARSLKYWAASGILTPEKDAVGRPGIRRGYTFENLVEIAVLNELRKVRIAMPLARKAIARLQEERFSERNICFLIITGSKLEVFTEESIKSLFIREMLGNRPKDPFEKKSWEQSVWRELTDRVLGSFLDERLLVDEAIVIIAVHSLSDKMREKVGQLDNDEV